MKKWLSVLLSLALLITMLPGFDGSVKAAGNYFIFTNEGYTATSARISTDQRITLTGTVNNIVGNSISYSVYQVSLSGNGQEKEGESVENQKANISLSGNTITIGNIQLFPGLNKIKFTGLSGSTQVSESIYIEYRNSPLLYNLTALINGSQFEIKETETTVIYSTASNGKSTQNISITGVAPNATQVTVAVNGLSYTYSVSSSGDWTFAASPLTMKQGKNTLVITVTNGSQSVQTTREIAFYNGNITFYDLKLSEELANGTTNSVGLESNPNFNVTNISDLELSGKALVPILIDSNGDITPDPEALPSGYTYRLSGTTTNLTNFTQTDGNYGIVDNSQKFMTIEFTENIGSGLAYDTSYSINFSGLNQVTGAANSSGTYSFKLRDANAPYIYDINYLSGYSDSMRNNGTALSSLEGTDIENANITSLPMGVEVLIGNYSGSEKIDIASVIKSTGATVTNGNDTGAVDTTDDYSYLQLDDDYNSVVFRTVDGVQQPFLRVIVEVTKLPSSGSQKVNFKIRDTTDIYPASITLMYGPFVKFDSVYDGMPPIPFDTTMAANEGRDYLIDKLNNFSGQLYNIANSADIQYSDTTGVQTVFLYVNNVEIKLVKQSNEASSKFTMDASQKDLLYGALFKNGANKVEFVYRTNKDSYKSTITVTIVATNIPVIPAPDTDGVYPFSYNSNGSNTTPVPNDPNFMLKDTVFTTTEAKMNVYGTFDFIDLGTTVGEVQAKISDLRNTNAASNYFIQIAPSGGSDITWSLSNAFTIVDSNGNVQDSIAGPTVEQLSVYYNAAGQYFYFILTNQQLPIDGSSIVYNMYVYNSGTSGPRASYRLEIDPTSIPYTVLAPLKEKHTLNQNFVEVIISSPGADSITIDGESAKKVTYLNYNETTNGEPEQISAFAATVKKLKAGKETKIKIVITNANDTINDTLSVTYVSENIPGAQYREEMSSSHKLFDKALTLTFPKNTNLIRSDYNTPDNLKTQVYAKNELVFAIANPFDGVVDRHDFETVPFNYDSQVLIGSTWFANSFSERFIKASPVYWIDGGQADDASTDRAYDPITYGTEPYPFAVLKGGLDVPYYMRDKGRRLVPSKEGELTLTYNPQTVQSAGTYVTVMRFDPFEQTWENIGGVVDAKKNTITVPFTKFGYYTAVELAYSFNDIVDHPYARNAMEAVLAKGVMRAEDPTGRFGADTYITRGEFVSMIVRALQMPLNYEGAQHFIDVPISPVLNPNALYDYRYIETAARAGIVRGTRPQTFEPTSSIKRQDAAVMLAIALNLKLDTNATKVSNALAKAFKDAGSISHYAKPSILAIQKKGFIKGSPADASDLSRGFVFEPSSLLLRSDAAIIIARVMADRKLLPAIYSN
ncbi:S-layer homology domain-containing protein [Paenibacillus tarimensis]